MEFGVQFFPAVGPDQKPADQYWREALELTQLAEQLGFTNVRTVEHYFLSYGGYSPDPLIFLSAAAALTRSTRLITGAVLPVFNNPLKLAGQIGMVDAISGGRLEVGFARAFLPHEFARFGISMDESRARFEEGLEQVRRLLEEENVTGRGRRRRAGAAQSVSQIDRGRGVGLDVWRVLARLSQLSEDDRRPVARDVRVAGRQRLGLDRNAGGDSPLDRQLSPQCRRLRICLAPSELRHDRSRRGRGIDASVRAGGDAIFRARLSAASQI